ncbi:Lrp/AsnC ligand binding domain-containing protein [Candidatus Bathyarchaeota archaeon]|nr:Lrp/AsnC ligand binding domain-containing protein [Candidatus Bathyarchaeota archaeon]
MATAFVFIITDPASMVEVLEEVGRIEGVEEAFTLYGIYDIVAKIKGNTLDELKEIIVEKIRGIDKVRRTLTMVVIQAK